MFYVEGLVTIVKGIRTRDYKQARHSFESKNSICISAIICSWIKSFYRLQKSIRLCGN